MLGGVTRMTVSLVVILFELTGALSHVLPIMISVMVSKWVGDAFGKEGIYSSWIALKNYQWLPSAEYKDHGETAANIMVPYDRLVTINAERVNLKELAAIIKEHDYHGYPVVAQDKQLLGYISRTALTAIIDPFLSRSPDSLDGQDFTFIPRAHNASVRDLSEFLEDVAIQLRKDVPQELAVNMFQKLNLRYIFFTERGKLTGLLTKSDVVSLMRAHVPQAGSLASERNSALLSAGPSEVVWEDR